MDEPCPRCENYSCTCSKHELRRYLEDHQFDYDPNAFRRLKQEDAINRVECELRERQRQEDKKYEQEMRQREERHRRDEERRMREKATEQAAEQAAFEQEQERRRIEEAVQDQADIQDEP